MAATVTSTKSSSSSSEASVSLSDARPRRSSSDPLSTLPPLRRCSASSLRLFRRDRRFARAAASARAAPLSAAVVRTGAAGTLALAALETLGLRDCGAQALPQSSIETV